MKITIPQIDPKINDKFFTLSFVICVFLAPNSIKLGFVDLYYYYIFIIVGFPILLFKYRTIDKNLLNVLLILAVFGILNILLGNNDTLSYFKISLGVLISFWYYFFIIKYNEFDLYKLIKLYYKFSIVMAYIGFVQFFSFIIGFKYGYEWSSLGFRVMSPYDIAGFYLYPIHAITGEPSAYAFLLAPAVYISLSRFNVSSNHVGSKFQALVIITSYILSQSSTGYFAIIVSLFLMNIKKINFSRFLSIIFILPFSILILYTVSPRFQERLDSSINLFFGDIVIDAMTEKDEAHGSVLVLYNHFLIARKNAGDHPFGTGLGSHHVAFHKYNTLQTWFTGYGKHAILLNEHDASSMFSRILSEMGWIGLILTFIFIFRNFLHDGPNHLVLINHAALVSICTALLRNGHYFIFGFPFFVFCYYYSYVFSKRSFGSRL